MRSTSSPPPPVAIGAAAEHDGPLDRHLPSTLAGSSEVRFRESFDSQFRAPARVRVAPSGLG